MNLESINIEGSNYNYSAVGLNNLGATEYTLVTINCDTSSSVATFKTDLEKCIKEAVLSCRKSPRADNLMLRMVTFATTEKEVHGFKLLTECNPDDYLNSLKVGGVTALFDTTKNSIDTTEDYAKTLIANDFDVNGIIFIITDGMDNNSANMVKTIKERLKNIQKNESIQSLTTVLIGVNITDDEVSDALATFKDKAELSQYIELRDASASTLARLADFISRSISSSSSSLQKGQQPVSSSLVF